MSLFDKISSSRRLYLTSLFILFLAACALPILFAMTLGGVLTQFWPDSAVIFQASENGISGDVEHDTSDKESVFPEALGVFAPNVYMTVRNAPSLDPKPGKDFVISVWLKLRKLPLPGESFVVFSKIDEKSASRKGYSFSLTMEQENLRPNFYWRDDNNGTWFTFSELPMKAKEWNLFVITLREEKYLGLHSASVVESTEGLKRSEIKLLGGYEFNNKILPETKSDLMAGSFNSGKFRGRIGPLGIFSGDPITDNLDSILGSLLENPLETPSQFTSEEVGLWIVNAKEDSGPSKVHVDLSKSKKD